MPSCRVQQSVLVHTSSGLLSLMAHTTFAWLSIIVKRCQEVVKKRTIVKCGWEDTFGSLFCKVNSHLKPALLDDQHLMYRWILIISRIAISKDEKFVDTHDVPPSAPISLCDQFRCMHVCIYLKGSSEERNWPSRTASSVQVVKEFFQALSLLQVGKHSILIKSFTMI